MCHDLIPLTCSGQSLDWPSKLFFLKLDLAHFHRGVILAMSPLNLVLVGLLELQHGQLFRAALLHDLARDAGLLGIRSRQYLLVVGVHRQHGPKLHLLAHITLYALNANRVAGCNTVLLSPGLYNGVHLSSMLERQTTIIRAPSPSRQRTSFHQHWLEIPSPRTMSHARTRLQSLPG